MGPAQNADCKTTVEPTSLQHCPVTKLSKPGSECDPRLGLVLARHFSAVPYRVSSVGLMGLPYLSIVI